MAILVTAVWRVRIGGNDLNGGAFDSAIASAGTDYTEQDAAQLSVTDLATSGVSATVTSATGGFTSAMIGNAMRIASGTNFTAGTYFVTGVTDTNTAVLDRNCTTGVGSAGVMRLGGAKAAIGEPVARGAIAGNVVMVRGQGLDDPVDIDYANVTISSGSNITYVGYNGRPKVSHPGRCFYLVACTIKNFFFVQTVGTNTEGAVALNTGSYQAWLIDCVVDLGGFSTTGATNYNVLQCTFMNSGTQVAGTGSGINLTNGGSATNCHVKDLRNVGIAMRAGLSPVVGCIVQNCTGDGITITDASGGSGHYTGGPVMNNTIYGCGGHGITIVNRETAVFDNLISNITGAGKYGISATYAIGAVNTYAGVRRNNFHGCTSNSNVALSALDTTLDPQYVNAPDDLTPTNTSLRYLSGVGA